MIGEEQYLAPGEMGAEAVRLGLECVPTYFNCDASEIHMDHLKALLTHTSILGGPIEGIVVKNYNLFTQEKKIAIAKLVREEFKETHKKEWKISNPTKKDVIEQLVAELATPARWAKAVQHLRDEGKLVNAPQDIGPLMKEIPADILKEEGEYIKQKLFCVFWEEIKRGVTRGFPDWYKQKLTSEVLSPQIEENERE